MNHTIDRAQPSQDHHPRPCPRAGPVAVVALIVWSGLATGQAYEITEFRGGLGSPTDIVGAGDGRVWFTDVGTNSIGSFSVGNGFSMYRLPDPCFDELGPGCYPAGITLGPDRALWFTEGFGPGFGRITTAGYMTEFPIGPGHQLQFITLGPDGNLWATQHILNTVARIRPSDGEVTEFLPPTLGSFPLDICPGPDGNVWFTEKNARKIARITPEGAITEFPITTPLAYPWGITAGADGNLWFAEQGSGGNRIGRITTSGAITEFPLPNPNSSPKGMTLGPDGSVWFTESAGNRVGRIDTSGNIVEIQIPTPRCAPHGICVGPDGNIWFTEEAGRAIGRVKLNPNSPTAIIANVPTLPRGALAVFVVLIAVAGAWLARRLP